MIIKALVIKNLKILVFAVTFVLLFSGCNALIGEEIARLKINKVSANANAIVKESTVNLKKGDEIALWSDMDLEYDGNVNLRFRIKMYKNGTKTSELEIDPMKKNLSIGEVKSKIKRTTKWSFLGKNSAIKIEEDASYTFKGILVASKNASLKINKAELILKI